MSSARGQLAILAAYGIVLARIALSTRLVAYVRPATRPLILVAGVAVALVGICAFTTSRTEHTSVRSLGWLPIAPLLVLLLVPPPGAGALAGARPPARPGPPSGSMPPLPDGNPARVDLSEVVQRAIWEPGTLARRQLRVVGYVVAREPTGLVVGRLSITCCAADAQQDEITARRTGTAGSYAAGQWVAVTGRFAGMSAAHRFAPELIASRIAVVAPPTDPYD